MLFLPYFIANIVKVVKKCAMKTSIYLYEIYIYLIKHTIDDIIYT